MYTRFFNLKEKPFNLTPDPKYLFLSNNHKEIYAQLLYSVKEDVGFVVLIGEIGTGKTTLCRAFLNQLPEKYIPAFIFNPNLDDLELYKSLNKELGVAHRYTSKKVLQDALNNYLLRMKRADKRVLLIIDEAQNLSQSVLEQIRLLSNLETETQKLIQIILVGQPELGNILEGHSLRQLNQRISVRCRLYPLNYTETKGYIRHRLKMAGCVYPDVFKRAALLQIYMFSRGTPRLINILCDRALLAAYSSNTRSISFWMVRKCIKEIYGGKGLTDLVGRLSPAFAILAVIFTIFYAGSIYGGWNAEAGPGAFFNGIRKIINTGKVVAPRPAEAAVTVAERPQAKPMKVEKIKQVAEATPFVETALPRATPEVAAQPMFAANAVEAGLLPIVQTPAVPEAEAVTQMHLQTDIFSKVGRRKAINAMIAAWGIDMPVTEQEDSFTFWRIALRRNMNCFAERLTLNMLRQINYPVVLEVRNGKGRTGYLSVVKVWGKNYYVDSSGTAYVDKEWLKENWKGRAYIFWKDYKKLPQIMKRGDRNGAVKWLQVSLRELGYTNVRPVGVFGRKTEKSVIRFQLDNMIRADGQVGALTKMFLYNTLPKYRIPKLT